MNLEQLKILHTLAEKRSFSETAKILHLSQPSVTMQIKSLEERYQTKLFERTTKQVSPTEAGKLLNDYAGKVLQLLDQAEKDIQMLTQTVHGELRIGASLTIGEYILPGLLGKFKKQYPDVKLLIEITNSDQLIRNILDRQIQLGFIEAPNPSSKIVSDSFQEDELVIIASRTQPTPAIGEEDEITVDLLKELPMIMREPGSGTRKVLEEALYQHDINPGELNVVLEIGSTEAIKSAVESGLGISIISKSCIRKEKELGLLREIRIKDVRIRRSLQLIYHKNKVMHPAEEAMVHFIHMFANK